ncbi:MAG: DNA-protecting protein DprA [Hydrogenophaga sp.]|nr:DNA-protecting protein DprA [Hydrogenophaga sp.]
MQRDELAAWLRLLLTPGLGRTSARQLLARFGLPEAVWGGSEAAWAAVVGPALAATMGTPLDGFDTVVDAHERWLDTGHDRHLLVLGDPRYPAELLEAADPPLALFVHGRLDALAHPRRLAVVGSRNPTAQGTQNAHAFAQALSEAGLCIVSGLALGVDGAAHTGALAGGGFTLAMVGTGLDRVYPSRHRELAHRIVAQGAMVSEYALGTPPLAQNFPQRNRLIAGLSVGTLVVEAALQSGSLITARLASEQGREVFAIPGSIHSTQARGCHALIRQGAKLVESAQDVLEELRLSLPITAPTGAQAPQAAQPGDALMNALGHDPVGLDTLLARTGIDTARLQAQLLELELEGRVARLPGGLLQRVAAV